jgi:hypothetical protein
MPCPCSHTAAGEGTQLEPEFTIDLPAFISHNNSIPMQCTVQQQFCLLKIKFADSTPYYFSFENG